MRLLIRKKLAATALQSRYTKRAQERKKRDTASQNHCQNECIGISRCRRNTKIRAVVDELGNPIRVMLTAENVHDVVVAEKILRQIVMQGSTVLADKAYGSYQLCEYIANHDADFCISPKFNDSDP